MGISVSGVTPVAAVVPGGGPGPRTPGAAGDAVEFGPAVVFTKEQFDQAVNIRMYDSTGQAIALTQWLRSGTLPVPGAFTDATS